MLHQVRHHLDEVGQRVPPREVNRRLRGAQLHGLEHSVGSRLNQGFGDRDARRSNAGALNLWNNIRQQLLSIDLHRVPRLVLDPLPELLELRTQRPALAQPGTTRPGLPGWRRQDALTVLLLDLPSLAIGQIADGLAVPRLDLGTVLEGDLALVRLDVLPVALVRHDREDVHVLVVDAAAALVHGEPHAAPDFLPLLRD